VRIDMNNKYEIGFILTILKQNQKFMNRSTTPTYILKPHRITPSPIYNTTKIRIMRTIPTLQLR
jgi:hypothetical protein